VLISITCSLLACYFRKKSFPAVNTAAVASKMTIAVVN